MGSGSTNAAPINWRAQLYAALGALVVSAAIGLSEYDSALLLYVLVNAILSVCIISLLIYRAFSKNLRFRRSQLLTLAIIWTISMSCFAFERSHPIDIRSTARWLAWSHDYKSQVLAQPQPTNGELKHIEWDVWGFPGAGDTTVFLVFDPTDSLSTAAKNHQSGKFNGIPCEVFQVRRLEPHWYTVIYFTGPYYWDEC
jgi:hypothetical protein